MRTIKTMLLLMALTFSATLMANANVEDKRTVSDVITEEIGKLLKNPGFEVNQEFEATITLAINNDNEMVVLSVASKNFYIENFVKSRLNYKKLPTEYISKRIYKVPVRVTPEK